MILFLPIIQRKQIKKAKGKWKLKHLTYYLPYYKFIYEYIEITDNKIIFFEKDPDIPSRVENISFSPYDHRDFQISTSGLTFENGEIWEFSIGETKKEKRLYPIMKRNSEGTRLIMIDDRAIIIDPVERKKAYVEERRTYYLLVEE